MPEELMGLSGGKSLKSFFSETGKNDFKLKVKIDLKLDQKLCSWVI